MMKISILSPWKAYMFDAFLFHTQLQILFKAKRIFKKEFSAETSIRVLSREIGNAANSLEKKQREREIQ